MPYFNYTIPNPQSPIPKIKMFANTKLKTRMLLGYAVPAAVYMGFAILVYWTVTNAFNTFKDVERVQKVIVGTNNMALDAQSLIRNARGYLIEKKPDFIQEYQTSLIQFREEGKALDKLIQKPEQKQRLAKMLELVNNYDTFSSEMIRLVDQNKLPEAIALFKTGRGTVFVEQFDKISQEFEDTEQKLLEQETKDTENALQSLLFVVIGSVLLIVITGVMALSISNGIAKTINQAATAIATSTTEISSTIEEQQRIANLQASSVNQTTTTMDELGASSSATAQQAEAASTGSRQVLTLTARGNEAVQRTIGGMTILEEKVGAIATSIVLLSEQTTQIGNISNVVTDLANQTNMLALNAAVEAVRAGEQGKGFSVVASEIRKLADQSKKSAEKINTLVTDIQKAINSTVIATDAGTQTVKDSVYIAQETAETFKSVATSIEQVVVNNQQIALNAKQQAIAIQQVVEAMNSINTASRETASGITQTRIGIEKLNEAALNLKVIV